MPAAMRNTDHPPAETGCPQASIIPAIIGTPANRNAPAPSMSTEACWMQESTGEAMTAQALRVPTMATACSVCWEPKEIRSPLVTAHKIMMPSKAAAAPAAWGSP